MDVVSTQGVPYLLREERVQRKAKVKLRCCHCSPLASLQFFTFPFTIVNYTDQRNDYILLVFC